MRNDKLLPNSICIVEIIHLAPFKFILIIDSIPLLHFCKSLIHFITDLRVVDLSLVWFLKTFKIFRSKLIKILYGIVVSDCLKTLEG